MDEYLDNSDVIVICKGILAMTAYYSMLVMRVLIEVELDREGLGRLPLTSMFAARRA